MYANAPHASAATSPPLSPLSPAQTIPGQAQHGQPQGLPPAAPGGGSHGTPLGAPVNAYAAPQTLAARSRAATYVTGAYQASGDPAIDRMLRLEAACKRFGSPL